MPTKRCRSTCATYKNPATCNDADKCSYTNGAKRKYCRLSSIYRMAKPNCNITRRYLKREKVTAAKRIQSFVRKTRTRRNRVVNRTDTEIPVSISEVMAVADDPSNTNRKIENAANRIRRFMQNVRTRKHKEKPLLKDASLGIDMTTEFELPPPDREKDIQQFHNKVQARRLVRFMKSVDPHKRRGAYLNGVCSDSGVCIAFGKEVAKIKKHFGGFTKFEHVTEIRKLGSESANGFVRELTYKNAGYASHAILKSSNLETSDNLYYEYLVGCYLNKVATCFPHFVETYGVYKYNTIVAHNYLRDITNTTRFTHVLEKLTLIDSPQNYTNRTHAAVNAIYSENLKEACTNSGVISILIQHLRDAKTISDMCQTPDFVVRDLSYTLFQIYFTLHFMRKSFTHYDLHIENVLLYEPDTTGYIQYHYHMPSSNVVSFKSRYLPKIIDYGRCHFKDITASTSRIGARSTNIYDKLCSIPECTTNPVVDIPIPPQTCGKAVGFEKLNPLLEPSSSSLRNVSADLRLLYMLSSAGRDFGGKYVKMCENVERSNNWVYVLSQKVNFDSMFTTREVKTSGLPDTIDNVTDAFAELYGLITTLTSARANQFYYKKLKKLGDMHVYAEDGRPVEFISAVN